jgi:hypothetical protein
MPKADGLQARAGGMAVDISALFKGKKPMYKDILLSGEEKMLDRPGR